MVDGTLLISGVIPEDSGNYTCMPTNGLLTPPTASANLTVMRTFLCRALSFFFFEIITYKQNKVLSTFFLCLFERALLLTLFNRHQDIDEVSFE